ncbi:MAG: murein L,D-transpeptidase catalytic domain family protein [Bacteroidota bacterium]
MPFKTRLSALVGTMLLAYCAILLSSPALASTEVNKDSLANPLDYFISSLYNNFEWQEAKPQYDIFKRGVVGYLNLKSQNRLSDKGILTLVDFRSSANVERMWVLDLKGNRVLYHNLVAHGRNSGDEYATKFSNRFGSYQSSLGFYVTGATYTGKHGLSLRLDGVEPLINSNARKRAVVMHSAEYVSHDFANQYGRLGRSLGCPAIPVENHKEVIDRLSDNTCLFIFYNSVDYAGQTTLHNEQIAHTFLVSNGHDL